MILPRLSAVLSVFIGGAAILAGAEPKPKLDQYWAYIGTYTGKNSKGIYRFTFDSTNGKLSDRELVAETDNPTFLAASPDGHALYACTEVSDFKGKKAGAIGAYKLDAKTGKLTLINQESTGGPGPCHLIVDHGGKHVLAANYGGGSTVVLPVGEDGKLGPATAFVQHKGSSINKQRQEGPHAHCTELDAAGRYAFTCDLGLDKVLIFKYDSAKGTLTANEPDAVSLKGGAGPRHIAFHPDGKHAYVNNELDSTVTAMTYDAEHGALKALKTLSTLPEEVKGNSTAEIEVHPSGKFVYVSNRGHNSIAIFRVDEKTGELTTAGHQGKGIKTPRNFAIDPTGNYLIVANQDSDSLVVFRIDAKTGALTSVGEPVDVGAPVCVKFVPKAS